MAARIDRNSRAHIDKATQLMRKAVDGNVEPFTRLYYEFCPILTRFSANYDGGSVPLEDFVQEVFIRLWQQRKSYRGTSGFLPYLLGIARYTFNQQIRKSRRIAAMRLKERRRLAPHSHNDLSQPEAELSFKELMAALEGAKASLTAKQQQVLDLS